MLASSPLNLARIPEVFDRKHIKILTLKQIALALVKAGKTFENLLNY